MKTKKIIEPNFVLGIQTTKLMDNFSLQVSKIITKTGERSSESNNCTFKTQNKIRFYYFLYHAMFDFDVHPEPMKADKVKNGRHYNN